MFIVVIFLLLAVMAGMAIDIARHETARADLQNALDRGVLAAANTDSGVVTKADAERIIGEYMASRTMRDATFDLTVDTPVGNAISGRTISATLAADVDTTFMAAMGVDTLALPLGSAAAESRGLTEIVLVLDVSGSMSDASTFSGAQKIDDLKTAVRQFVTTVMPAPGDPNAGRVMLSIVPYSAQVSLPPWMAAAYNLDGLHDLSYCVDYRAFDFTTPAISTSDELAQAQHFPDSWYFTSFQRNGYPTRNSGVINNFNCPSANNAILPFETDRQAVLDYIDGLTTQLWTASDVGMKWGAHLLDPSSRPVLQAKYADTAAAATYRDWPHDWNATSVNKVIILMTDGVNTVQERINDAVYADYTTRFGAEVFANPANLEEFSYPSYFLNDDRTFFYRHIDNSNDNLTVSDGKDIDRNGITDDCGDRLDADFRYRYRTGPWWRRQIAEDVIEVQCGQADFQLMELCSRLKSDAHGARIYTIGFELRRGNAEAWWDVDQIAEAYEARQAEAVLQNCASAMSNHYYVEGVDIVTAFGNIGNELRLLRLIN